MYEIGAKRVWAPSVGSAKSWESKKDDKSGAIKTNAHRRVGLDDMHSPGEVMKVFHNHQRQRRRHHPTESKKRDEIKEGTHAPQERIEKSPKIPTQEQRMQIRGVTNSCHIFCRSFRREICYTCYTVHTPAEHLPALFYRFPSFSNDTCGRSTSSIERAIHLPSGWHRWQ